MRRGAAKARMTNAVTPKGARPPRPGLGLNLLRFAWLLCVIVLIVRSVALEWSAGLVVDGTSDWQLEAVPDPADVSSPPELPPLPFPEPPDPMHLVVMAVERLYAPPIYDVIQGIVWFGAAWLLIELVIAGFFTWLQPHLLRWQGRKAICFWIRAPRQLPVPGGKYITEPDHDLFRAIAAVIPTRGRWCGWSPWVAFTLAGQPDQPIELGVTIAAGWKRRRQRIATGIINALTGLQPGVVVDECPDQLRAVMVPHRVVVWREYGLALPPQYPLRLLDDVEHSVLMGPLLSALRPRDGVVATEAQFIIRPVSGLQGWGLHRGWRGHATAMRLKLDAKKDYALADDVKTLEAKLAGVAYETTLRVVVVTEGAGAYRNATQMLNMVGDAFGEYQARTSHHVQRLKPINTTRVWLRHCPSWRSWLYGRPWAWIWRAAGFAALVMGLRRVWETPPQVVPALLAARMPDWTIVQLLLDERWLNLGLYGLGLLAVVRVALEAPYVGHGVRQQRMCERVLGRLPRGVPPPTFFLPPILWRRPMVLSSVELGGFWHLPTPWVGNLVQWLTCRHLPPPPAAFTNGDPKRIVFGYARRGDGSYAPVGPSLRDLRQPLHVTAGMGAGKSRLGANILRQILGEGFTLIDGKGDDAGNLTMTVRKLIPREDEERVIILDVLDAEWPVGINPLSSVDLAKPGAIDLVVGQVEAIFSRIDSATWSKSPGMQQFLRNATLLVIEGHCVQHDASGVTAQLEPSTAAPKADPPGATGALQAPTFAHIKQALIDASYREQLLPTIQNMEVKTFWELTFPALGESQRTSLYALLRRFDMLLTTELTRLLLTQPAPLFSFRQAIEQHRIVLVPIPHVTLGGLAEAVAMLTFREFIRAAFARPGSDQTRDDYGLMIDELQVLVENSDPRDVENALSQLRAFGISAMFLHQALTQLGDSADIVRINTRSNRIIMQTGEPDAGTYAREYLAHGLTAADISFQNPLEHQYAVMRCENVPCGPFSMRPLMWPEPVNADVSALDGPDWQTLIPTDSPDASFDIEVTRLVHGTHAHPNAIAVALAEQFSDTEWEQILVRWDAIRRVQRQYILDYPGCIPDRLERQRWLSRLLVARPRILAMATYARIRTAIDPQVEGQSTSRPAAKRQVKGQVIGNSVGGPVTDPATVADVLADVQSATGYPVTETDPIVAPDPERRDNTMTVIDPRGKRRIPKFTFPDRKQVPIDTSAVDMDEVFTRDDDS
jgi:hypothetical protein